MSLLATAVVVVGVLGAVNLVLTYGVIRRLRQHTDMFVGLGSHDETTPQPGAAIKDFLAIAIDGTTVSPATFHTPTLVGFLSTDCPPCAELLPRFIAAAKNGAAGSRAAVAAVIGDTDGTDYVDRLAGVATVLIGQDARGLAAAFAVRGYPGVCVADRGGVVTASGTRLVDQHDFIAPWRR